MRQQGDTENLLRVATPGSINHCRDHRRRTRCAHPSLPVEKPASLLSVCLLQAELEAGAVEWAQGCAAPRRRPVARNAASAVADLGRGLGRRRRAGCGLGRRAPAGHLRQQQRPSPSPGGRSWSAPGTSYMTCTVVGGNRTFMTQNPFAPHHSSHRGRAGTPMLGAGIGTVWQGRSRPVARITSIMRE